MSKIFKGKQKEVLCRAGERRMGDNSGSVSVREDLRSQLYD